MIKKRPKPKTTPPNNFRKMEIQETSKRKTHPCTDVFPELALSYGAARGRMRGAHLSKFPTGFSRPMAVIYPNASQTLLCT